MSSFCIQAHLTFDQNLPILLGCLTVIVHNLNSRYIWRDCDRQTVISQCHHQSEVLSLFKQIIISDDNIEALMLYKTVERFEQWRVAQGDWLKILTCKSSYQLFDTSNNITYALHM